ncbi:hypothetical protein MNBD_CHLOROFLEXI01-1865 [hydrothermal vent metagenome]|uniref:Uncharacterized protein n=1 Tax=hydrothermal vent metagenome TaxID=652676 RepID=A0A3B0UM51_9ZZZZ
MEHLITSTTEIESLQTETMFSLDQLIQCGARRMLEAALVAEVEAYIQCHQKERDEAGHAWWFAMAKARNVPFTVELVSSTSKPLE